MTDNKISKPDKAAWDAYIKSLDTCEEDDIAEFEEAIESYDFSSIPSLEKDISTSKTKKYIRLKIENKNLRTPPTLKNGIKIDATLDLHGKNLQNAYISFIAFIESSYIQGNRNLLVITGKGKTNPGGIGAIKKEFKTWLTQDNIADKVIRATYAKNKDGGEGAFYIFLKKHS